MLTISMNINFNKIVETSNLQQSYTQYFYSVQIVKNNYSKPGAALVNTISSFMRTSNFGAEAERSYILLRFEAENVLKMFLNYMVYTTVNQCGHDRETYQSALPAEI